MENIYDLIEKSSSPELLRMTTLISLIAGIIVAVIGIGILLWKKKNWSFGIIALGLITAVFNGFKLKSIVDGNYQIPDISTLINAEGNLTGGSWDSLVKIGMITSIGGGLALIAVGVYLNTRKNRKKPESLVPYILMTIGAFSVITNVFMYIF